MQALLVTAIAAHVGGVPTQARFETPAGVGMVGDQGFEVVWTDGDIDPTGLFDFYFQPSNVPPLAPLTSPAFVGMPIAGAQDVMIMDVANRFTWDTSGVPSGSYFLYEITEDPPLMPLYGISSGPVTVRHPGDPLWPAVVVIQPDGIGDITGTAFAIQWLASGEGPLTANVEWAKTDGDGTLVPLATDHPMLDNGDGTASGCLLWDLSSTPQGYYYLRIEVSDQGGRTHAAYSPATVVVYRDPSGPDAGPAPMCAELPPDAGTTGGDDVGGPKTCACRAGGGADDGTAAAGAIAALLLGASVLATRASARRRS